MIGRIRGQGFGGVGLRVEGLEFGFQGLGVGDKGSGGEGQGVKGWMNLLLLSREGVGVPLNGSKRPGIHGRDPRITLFCSL